MNREFPNHNRHNPTLSRALRVKKPHGVGCCRNRPYGFEKWSVSGSNRWPAACKAIKDWKNRPYNIVRRVNCNKIRMIAESGAEN